MSSPQQGGSPPPVWINYLYFGLLLLLLACLSVSGMFATNDLAASRPFFLFYSFGEAVLEVVLLILVGWLIRHHLPPFCFFLYAAFTFICLIAHILDFGLEKIIHFSLFETFAFVAQESPANFYYMLDASGIPLWMWGVFFLIVASLPLCGALLYRATEWISNRKPLSFRLDPLLQAALCIPIALLLWDYSASKFLPYETYRNFTKTLPWKTTVFGKRPPHLLLEHPLPSPPEEAHTAVQPLAKRPNIYLFIVESLRSDAIASDTTPTLKQFQDRHLHGSLSLASANATQLSWFSIFYANFPFYWNSAGPQGSPALRLLKQLGYQIRVYSSANLDYYNMKEKLFGKKACLADTYRTFPHPAPREVWESDAASLEAAQEEWVDPALSEGQCFIFFWDATHFDYSWPKDQPPRFSPIAKDLNYFKAYFSPSTVAGIKNRYKNALYFIDRLFAKFLTSAPHASDAIIVFAGDHGEEFLEHGHLFHLSDLNDKQTEIPLIFQLPRRPASLPPIVSQSSIFPTLVDVLCGDGSAAGLLAAPSLFANTHWPYAVSARYNASRTPFEFILHNGQRKLHARFSDTKDIFKSKYLEILSLRTCNEESCKREEEPLNAWIQREFGDGLEKLFTPRDSSATR